MKSAIFFDIGILIKSSPKAWVIDKNSPSHPIEKMEISDFNLFRSGSLKSQGNKIDFNGKIFWVSTDFMNSLKIKCKKNNTDISNLGISMQEFLNPELTQTGEFEINENLISHINRNEELYIICSKNKKEFFKNQIKDLESRLKKLGISVKRYYYTSETFLNKKDDFIAYIKSKIIVQHLLGIRCERDVLTEEKLERYDRITFIDDSKKSIQSAHQINMTLDKLISNSSDYVKGYVRDTIKDHSPHLLCREYTHNKSNIFIDKEIKMIYPNITKKFENFNY